ncbi:MAG: GDP-mannose 4,6-dehydratase [Candidatus Neomarinimicrobiota bacterium]|nr:GDP-mannose 4,6-dehydratase [Candidatus Neomarinimicrobiota bacterium]|tara:strand:+ start:699 stop:1727 length:1029 start_codon:yes stop_codon:yes gene_type:complete
MNKTILITGGAGFIAHHVIDKILATTDWNIVTLDRLDFSGNLNRLNEVVMSHDSNQRSRVRVIHHDLKSEINPEIANTIGEIDYIAHLAAGSHVDRSITFPLEFVMDNVVGTANILDFARKYDKGIEQFVYFSTDEVFGPAPDGISYKENDRYNSTNPYSASKAGGEELVVAYNNTYGIPAIITHTMNVFGERQNPEKYIPMVIKKVRDNELVTVHANPEKTHAGSRHYIHAEDVAEALMFLFNYDLSKFEPDNTGAKCQKFNIVGKDEIDNLTLAKFIAEVQEKELKYEMVDFHSQRPGHDLRYALDGTKMKAMGWEPHSAYDRLKSTIEWTLENDRWLKI